MKKSLWLQDNIQFPRLIAELEMCEAFTPKILKSLSESMNLEISYIGDLIDRAKQKFDKIKETI